MLLASLPMRAPSQPRPSGSAVQSAVSTPLEDISNALYSAYKKSSWSHQRHGAAASASGSASPAAVPAPLYAAALRAALLPWDEPPKAVGASLPERVKRGYALSQVLGVDAASHQEVRGVGAAGCVDAHTGARQAQVPI